jgi:acyl CoA:acetate/3-ketoacid CoA transferase
MDFRPIIKEPLKLMDARIFQTQPMGLADGFFQLPHL